MNIEYPENVLMNVTTYVAWVYLQLTKDIWKRQTISLELVSYQKTTTKYLSICCKFLTRMIVLQLPMLLVPITTKVVSSNPAHGGVYSIQHCVIKFVSDLR
jgi:hypothetical protein